MQGQQVYQLWYDNAHYDTEHAAMYKRCGNGLPYPDPGAPPVRTCMQQILHSYRMQGVTGVRIMFEMHDILDGPAWLTGFRNLLDDLVAAQIYYVTLTPGWNGANWNGDNPPLPNHHTVVQNPEPRADPACNDPQAPYSKPAYMRFSPTSPYGERCIQDLVNHPEKPCTMDDPWSGLEWRIDGTTDDKYLNQTDEQHAQECIAYRCSPVNPYFLGWPTILDALGTALQAVHDSYSAGLRLRELDVSAGASVTFASANFVRLGPGFQATAGTAATTFRAVIDPTIH